MATIKINFGNIYSIRDSLGITKAKVYVYTKDGDNEPVWKQFLPTPYIRNFSHQIILASGGSLEEGDLALTNIPKHIFNRAELETDNISGNVVKYWVINNRAYTTVNIKDKLYSYEAHIRRYDPINEGDLVNPLEGQ